MGIISCVPPRPVTTLQSCGHVDCSVVDVGSPCERVELNLVVDDLSASVGGVHQIEAFDFVSASAKASGDPVPDDLRAVVDNVEGGNSWNGWRVHNALEVCLLASESDSAELDQSLALLVEGKPTAPTGKCSRDKIESDVSLKPSARMAWPVALAACRSGLVSMD